MRTGLADNLIKSILQTNDGTVWVATAKGISRFDPSAKPVPGRPGWVTHTLLPHLASDIARGGLRQSLDGEIWINHFRREKNQSVIRTTRYLLDSDPPETVLTVLLDKISQPGNTALAWRGADAWHATPVAELLYAHRLDGGEWSAFAPEKNKLFLSLSSGEHTFEVKARDRDFNEDPTPAIARFTVVPPVWKQPWFVGLLAALFGAVVLQTGRVIRRDRRPKREMERELQTAHTMQMGLMPKENPQIEGLDIAGRCIPANHVGGDYYQYFYQSGKLAIGLADVTGHAMEAAIPMVMFSGILKSHMELSGTLQERFERLNRSLCGTLTGRTFVCFVMAELDLDTRTFCLSDSGYPYPYHFRSATGELFELPIDSYPLGVRSDTEYLMAETRLESGDRVIFCSDGIIEAENAVRELFGYDRTAETLLKLCQENLSAEATIDRILKAVNAFKGNAPQTDDMTCVVLRVK